MSVLLPCLPPDWPGSRIPAFSTMLLSCALRMCITSWLVQLSRTTGRQSCGLSSVVPPLWSRLMVPFISSTVITRAPSRASISLAHALSTSSSACDIVFTHSFVYPSGPGDLFAFKQLSTKLLNSLSVTLPLSLALGSILVLFLKTPALKRKLMSAKSSRPWRRCVCRQQSSQKPVSCRLGCS